MIIYVYSVDEILTGFRNPSKIGMEANRLFAKWVLRSLRPAENFFEKDWDNLLILDACRHDLISGFEIPGAIVGTAWSGGSNSRQFITFNLRKGPVNDVVWVTANPWVSRYRDHIFRVVDAWDTHWNDRLGTVLPADMTSLAMEASSNYPDKRLVVHFMQPHYPFIGEFARATLPESGTFTGGGAVDTEDTDRDIWNLLRDGEVNIPMDDLWRAYEENLEIVLPEALNLKEELSGKTVLTSDHGNEFGGRGFPIPVRIYGHPPGLRSKNLVRVPWIVFESEDRRNTKPGAISNEEEPDSRVMERRLRDLGYLR